MTGLEFLLLPFFRALHLFRLPLSLPSILPYFVPGRPLVVPCPLLVWFSVGLLVALFLSTPCPASLFTLSSSSLTLFFPSFSALYWPATWSSLFFLPLDRKVSDLNWKIAHRVLYTAQRLSSWCPTVPLSCFCGFQLESLEHLFFFCPLVQSGYAWVQTQLSLASPLAPSTSLRHALFCFSSGEMRCVPRVFCYLLNVCKYLVWLQRNNHCFRSEPPVQFTLSLV